MKQARKPFQPSACLVAHFVGQYHFGGKPPASYTEGELRREKFPACRQLQATCKPYLCDLSFKESRIKACMS